jgi:hypothetical protein
MLTLKADEDPTKVEYSHTIIFTDSNGKEYTFRSMARYHYDQSGLAYDDLAVLRTMGQR